MRSPNFILLYVLLDRRWVTATAIETCGCRLSIAKEEVDSEKWKEDRDDVSGGRGAFPRRDPAKPPLLEADVCRYNRMLGVTNKYALQLAYDSVDSPCKLE